MLILSDEVLEIVNQLKKLKMTMKFLALILFVSSTSGLLLEPICYSSRFSYKGVSVNAFHRIPQTIVFQPFTHYLVDHNITCDPNEFQNKSNYMEVLKARNRYNNKFVEIYSESFLNKCDKYELDGKSIELRNIYDYIFHMSLKEKQVKCLSLFEETMYKGHMTLNTLLGFFMDGLPFMHWDMSPTKNKLLAELDKTIKDLQIEEDSQTFAFESLPIKEIYEQYIVLREKFEFFGEENPQRGRLLYDLILPFNNKKAPTGSCFKKEELSDFYKSEVYRRDPRRSPQL